MNKCERFDHRYSCKFTDVNIGNLQVIYYSHSQPVQIETIFSIKKHVQQWFNPRIHAIKYNNSAGERFFDVLAQPLSKRHKTLHDTTWYELFTWITSYSLELRLLSFFFFQSPLVKSTVRVYITVGTSIICEPIVAGALLYFRVAINWIGIRAISTKLDSILISSAASAGTRPCLFAQFQFTTRQRRTTPEEHCRPSMPKVCRFADTSRRAIFIAKLCSPLSALSSFLAARREAF